MSAVGIGVVGAGVISAQYLANMAAFPDLRVLFVADLDTGRAAARAAEFSVPRSGTLDELLADDDIEIVVNLTVPAVHAEVGMQVLAAGKHLWSEKPIALDPADARRMLAAATATGLRVGCAPDTILGAGLQTAARLVTEGVIGEPLTAMAMFRSRGPEQWHPAPEFLFAAGGGPLLDMGPYYFAALVQMLGPVSRVTAVAATSTPTRTIGAGPRAGTSFAVSVATHHAALVEFRSGASAQVVFSFQAHRAESPLLEVSGTRGTVVLPDPNKFAGSSEVWADAGDEPAVVAAEGATSGRGIGVLEMARALRAGHAPRASGELAAHVLDVMTAIADSAARGEALEVASTVEPATPLPVSWDPTALTLG